MSGTTGTIVVGVLLVCVVGMLAVTLSVLRRTGVSGAPRPTAPPDPSHDDAVALRSEIDRERAALRQERDASAAEAREILDQARRDADRAAARLLAESRETAQLEADRLGAAAHTLTKDLDRREQRMHDRENRLDAEQERLRQRDHTLTRTDSALTEWAATLDGRSGEHLAELERLAGLTATEARAELLDGMALEVRRESALLIRDEEARAREEADQRARHVIVEAIARVASEQTSESVVSVMHLPSDEMKGRIIGREGRNIRSFEAVTGVNVIIDDTPEAVLLSCFDPVRREVGRLTLEKLVADGRIHPHRIEEMHQRSQDEVAELCTRAAQDAIIAVGIDEVHPELVATLGRLRYRTSYGQNVLKHLVETAHIAGLMAAELRMDPRIVKRAAFLHDIGKALTHEVEGSHAIVGAELARRFGEDPEVVHAIEAHHNEVPPETVEAVLTQASDSCSGGRPGARRESLETYVKRLQRIEEIAVTRPGVEKVFAMQAGREVRVMVAPDQVDDVGAHLLAREVAKQIEDELTYPGQIRVTVVRETRSSEIAH